MRYTPAPVPAGIPKSARAWLADELRKVASAVIEADAVNLAEQAIEPDKLADGIVAYANGVDWDPGLGEGVYARINATWESLGYGNLNSAADETILGDWIFSGSVDFDNTVDFTGATVVGLSSDDLSDVASIAMLDENETISGSWSFIGTGGITIGDGNSADNEVLLKFAMDRAWEFFADGEGASNHLGLRSTAGGAKSLRIYDDNDVLQFQFSANLGKLSIYDHAAAAKQLDIFHDGDDAIITHDESTGDVYINNGTTGDYGPAALGILDPISIADDATQTWTLHRTIGIMIMTNNFGISTSAIVAYSGTSMSVIWKGTNVSVGTSGSNPDVDTDVNIWISPSGTLNIKNRMGSARTFNIYTFVG